VTTVLVTGAAGFAGSHLVDLLRKSGQTVTGWRRQDVDVMNRDAVEHAIAELKPSTVFHCAGAAHVAQSWTSAAETLATNVMGTRHVLDALRKASVHARVLIPGSSYVYREANHALSESDPVRPSSPYALSKLAQEMLGRRAFDDDGQQVFLTRSFNHIGPHQKASYAASGFARQIAMIERGATSPVIEVGNLDARRDLTDVRDTVRAYRAIVERGRPGAVYNVCSGTAYEIRTILERLVAMSSVRVQIRVNPERYRPSDMPLLLGDPSRIKNEVGWQPECGIDKTLSDLLDFWRNEVE
jgi:GDP-4-dehydro-6-deoxy-D-mannose reductase